MRLVVVGGGVAGLAAAWAASRGRPDVEVVVLEREAEVGGKARSVTQDGWLCESGPSGFLTSRPELEQLILEAGLRDDVVMASAAAKRRFIVLRGRMREVAPRPSRFLRSGLLTARGTARLLAEPFVPRHRGGEESVWQFAARRLGPEVADHLIAPMTLGVFAGDARRLSLDAAFPRMRAMEREHGSLVLALVKSGGRMGGGLRSFRGGMQVLPRALARSGRFQVRTTAEVRALTRENDRWAVWLDRAPAPMLADAVVLAGEPWAMSGLLDRHDPSLSSDLRSIRCPPVAVVALGYAPGAAARLPAGFGALVARGEGYRMLGNLWETQIYPGRAPDGHLLLRAMFGGSVDEDAAALDPDAMLALARAEVERLYGIQAQPLFSHVVRWPRAIPQYELGHGDRVARIERAVRALPGMWITGSALHGVSVADAAASGIRTGLAAVRLPPAP